MGDGLHVSVELNVFLNFSFYCIYDLFIWWFLFELQSKYFFVHVSQIFWNYPKDLFGIFDIKPFSKEIFKFHVLIFKLFMEIAPWQIIIVQ